MNSFEYRLIQFLQDPIREEGRNIGVVLFNGTWAGFRSVGMIDGHGKADLSRFIGIAEDNKESIWVFGEWIEWFKALCTESKGNNEIINAELDALENHSPQFIATTGGYFDSESEDAESALRELFQELIRQPRSSAKPEFQEQLEQSLIKSEIPFHSGYDKSIEVTIEPGEAKPPIVFTLDYYIDGERKIGIKVIKFHHSRASVLDTKTNDAIYTFSQAQLHSFLEKDKCIVLCDSPTESKLSYVERLSEVATVIDITKDGASGKIARACTA